MVIRMKPLGWATAALVVALAATACGESKNVYVSNPQESVFFRVPKTWRIFRLTASDTEGRPETLPASVERTWHLAADSDANPDLVHLVEHGAQQPILDAGVYTLSESANDRMSLSQVRTIAFGVTDPISYDPGAPPRWEIVADSYKPLAFPKGVTGNRVAINVPDPDAPDDKTKWATIDAVTIHDPVSSRVYIFKIRCASQCYLDNRAEINEILESWTVNRT